MGAGQAAEEISITHMLTGWVNVLRNTTSFRLSLVHGLWAWSALLLAIGNWASFWGMRSIPSWPSWTVLLCVAVMITLYVFCALVTPELPQGDQAGAENFHKREHSRYTIAAAVFFCLAIAANTALGGSAYQLVQAEPPFAALAQPQLHHRVLARLQSWPDSDKVTTSRAPHVQPTLRALSGSYTGLSILEYGCFKTSGVGQ